MNYEKYLVSEADKICAACGIKIGTVKTKDVSHGLCKKCYDKQMDVIAAYKSKKQKKS